MSKQKSIYRTLMVAAICFISLCAFKAEASANGIEVSEIQLDQEYLLDGFPLVYTEEGWLFQIKANEAVIIAYLGDSNEKMLSYIETPQTILMRHKDPFPVKAIGYNAFSPSNTNFSKAKSIMRNVFKDKTNIWNIDSIKINYGVDALADGAFAQNKAIRVCNLPQDLLLIGTGCFSGCTNLQSVNIPSSVDVIPSSCFKNCVKLPTIELHSGVTTIGGSAFYGCTLLGQKDGISLPNNITNIGISAFEYCTCLKTINIPTNVENINSKTFAHCNVLENVVIHENVKSIGSYAFAYRVYGVEYEFDFNVPDEYIKVKPVILNEGVKRIDAYAFYDIPIMRKVLIPFSVESIGSQAFGYYESKAGTRSIPNFKIEGYYDSGVEDYANNNKQFDYKLKVKSGTIIETKDAKYTTTDVRGEVIFTHNDKTSATSVTVPATIKKGNKTYTVTSIADNAFKGSKYLKTVSTGDEVKTIGKGAFKGCKALEKVKTGTKLQTIGDEAFAECKKLKEVTLEKGVKTIGKKAFYNCKKLEKVTIKSKKLEKIGAKAFKNINKKTDFELPGSKLKAYKKKISKAGAPKKVTYSKIKSTK